MEMKEVLTPLKERLGGQLLPKEGQDREAVAPGLAPGAYATARFHRAPHPCWMGEVDGRAVQVDFKNPGELEFEAQATSELSMEIRTDRGLLAKLARIVSMVPRVRTPFDTAFDRDYSVESPRPEVALTLLQLEAVRAAVRSFGEGMELRLRPGLLEVRRLVDLGSGYDGQSALRDLEQCIVMAEGVERVAGSSGDEN